jgi:diguanylate cyclase (GGDEF)-like protein
MEDRLGFTGVWKRWVGIRTAGISALVVLLVVATFSYYSIRQLEERIRYETLVYKRLAAIEVLHSRIKDSQRGMRGYIITGEARYLQPYFITQGSVDWDLAVLRSLFVDSPPQLQRISQMEKLIRDQLSMHQRIIEIRSSEGFEAAQAVVRTGRDKQSVDDLQKLVEEIRQDETASLNRGNQTIETHARITVLALVLGTFVILGLLTSAYFLILHKMDQYREAEEKSDKLNRQLETSNRDVSLLNQTAEMLQSCQTSDEAYRVIWYAVEKLLEVKSGALFLMKESKNYLENVSVIGKEYDSEMIFPPDACWALRQGHAHRSGGAFATPRCQHLKISGGGSALCIPLVAQGETLGVLTLLDDAHQSDLIPSDFMPPQQRLAQALTESIALSLANIKLREALRNQSISDPLTSLFNRRYMEETLERELARAERKRHRLGYVMMDLDHFKRFNDTFGHEAGDLLLKEFSMFVQSRIRKEDIFCRYGGEEFVLIFPETSLEDTALRADQIRESMRHLHIIHQGRSLGALTVSAGISAYPEHGLAQSLMQVADAALYRAKAQGRNQIIVGQSENSPRDSTLLHLG